MTIETLLTKSDRVILEAAAALATDLRDRTYQRTYGSDLPTLDAVRHGELAGRLNALEQALRAFVIYHDVVTESDTADTPEEVTA